MKKWKVCAGIEKNPSTNLPLFGQAGGGRGRDQCRGEQGGGQAHHQLE
mgnify:CR=1 FL=1